jgi:DNA polymerase
MGKRVQETAAPLVPPNPTIPKLAAAAENCRACDLWKTGTQTVFGEGGPKPRVMLVGEQPGDQEDIQGRPFVGPAGKILDKALAEAGIERKEIYVTNAVKHFKWEPRGKRRIHKKPNSMEIAACKPWIDAEIDVLHPAVIVCLGATAAQSLLGRQFKVSTQRGVWVPSPLAPFVMATVHPSSLLRAPDEETRRRETARFVEDLKLVHEALKHRAA